MGGVAALEFGDFERVTPPLDRCSVMDAPA